MTAETSRSVLIRFPSRLARRRAALLRAAWAAYGLTAEGGGGVAPRLDLALGACEAPRGAVRLPEGALKLDRGPMTELLRRELRNISRGGGRGAAPSRGASGKALAPRGKALFFRNLLNSDVKELGAGHIHQGVFYIVSALKRAGHRFILSDSRISLGGGFVTRREELDRTLRENPDINFMGITLHDSYFEKAAELVRHIRSRSRAFIAVGGLMPSSNPLETLAHLPGVDFVVRGAGEEIVCDLLSIIGASDARSGLDAGQLESLRRLEGLLCLQPGVLLLAGAHRVLRVADLDRSRLDFSILGPDDVGSGAVLSLSRGCRYACRFCSSMDRGRFAGKSPADTARLLAAYGRRLRELYGRWSRVPAAAFGIGFYDDDFLGDPARAAEIFRIILASPFHVRFFQTSVNSFFRRGSGRGTRRRLDTRLLDAMPEELFLPRLRAGVGTYSLERPYVYVGTENFCDEELERLGKGYGYAEVERLVCELSRRRIRQAHHWIAANAHTTPGQVLENLVRIARLRSSSGGCFDVLRPVIPHLVSFYPTASYARLASEGMLGALELRGLLAAKGYGELDYPLVERDLPADPDARDLAEDIGGLTDGEWDDSLGKALYRLLLRSESLALDGGDRGRARALRRLVDRYHDYPKMVLGGTRAAPPTPFQRGAGTAVLRTRRRV